LPPSPASRKTPVTHCRWNHEYAPQNTRIRRDGKRVCRQCERDRARRYATARGDRPGRRASGRISVSGWPRGDRLARRQIMRRAWVTRAAGDRPLSDEDPKLKGKAGTGRMWSWSADRREAELAKCERTVDVTCVLEWEGQDAGGFVHFGASSQTARLRVNGAKVCSASAFWMSIRIREDRPALRRAHG
jgi:hypothetical protein